MNKNYILMR